MRFRRPSTSKCCACAARALERFCAQTLGGADLYLLPGIAMRVPTRAQTGPPGGADMPRMLGEVTRLTRWVNYLGVPALVVPCGVDSRGLPLGAAARRAAVLGSAAPRRRPRLPARDRLAPARPRIGCWQRLGYAALFIGTLLEGETIVFLAGLAAHPRVPLVSRGRCGVRGRRISLRPDPLPLRPALRGARVRAIPGLAARVPRVHALLLRWDVLAILLVRFLWGLRVVAPLVIGSCGIAPWRLALSRLPRRRAVGVRGGGPRVLAGQADAVLGWRRRSFRRCSS